MLRGSFIGDRITEKFNDGLNMHNGA